MNRRRLLTLMAGVAATTATALGLAHGHGHGSHSHHHSDHVAHEHHSGADHQHDDQGHPSHYHHDHDDSGNHYHNCRHTEDVTSSQQYRDGCVDHDSNWEDRSGLDKSGIDRSGDTSGLQKHFEDTKVQKHFDSSGKDRRYDETGLDTSGVEGSNLDQTGQAAPASPVLLPQDDGSAAPAISAPPAAARTIENNEEGQATGLPPGDIKNPYYTPETN